MSYTPKVYKDNGGDRLVVASGGAIKVLTGGALQDNDGNAYNLGAGIATATASTTAELNRLNTVTPGTAAASKAAVLGADKNLDVLAVADFKLGAGAGVSVTATAAELNDADVSARSQALTEAGAIDLDARYVSLAGPAEAGTYAVTLAAPARPGITKVIEMISGAADKTVTLALTNVVGQSSGTGATFGAAGDTLVVVSSGTKWVVLAEVGLVLA